MKERTIRVAVYGSNGHQIHQHLGDYRRAELIAAAGVPEAKTRQVENLDALLADASIDLISLCSPCRADQAADAIRCLRAGKHVYAEKPSALTERELDEIIAVASSTGRRYHEQAITAFTQPYATLRQIAASGALGEIVQVYAQKSYPWYDARPQDESIDGGLATQAGVYCARFVEHIAGQKIASIALTETRLGNPIADGHCRRAVAFQMTLANGGLASGIANYLAPPPQSWGRWGYEILRIWGTKGLAESIDCGRIGTLAVHDQPARPIDFSPPVRDLLDLFLEEIQTGRDLVPFTLADELSPTRWILRKSL